MLPALAAARREATRFRSSGLRRVHCIGIGILAVAMYGHFTCVQGQMQLTVHAGDEYGRLYDRLNGETQYSWRHGRPSQSLACHFEYAYAREGSSLGLLATTLAHLYTAC